MEKPKIRFLKNKHSWVRNTFEEIAKRRTKSSDNPDLPRIEYQDIISGEGRLNKDLNKNIDCRKGIVFETNDILYGKLRPYLKNWLHPNFNGIALGDFWVLQARNCDSKFLFSLVQSPKFQRVANDTSGTKMPRSDWKTVSQTEFSIPTSNEEQSAIGSLFRTLDDLLSSYKDNLANYQSLKATMLSKMFPKAGQTVPEIRLAGFKSEWEINKLNKYLAVSKQKNTQLKFDKEDVLSVSGEFGIINQIQFQGRSFAGASVEMYSIVDTGNIVYTKSPLKASPYGIIKTNYGIPGIVSTLYAVYLPNENVFPGFVERYFENDLRLNSYLKPLVNKGAKNDMKVSDENALLGAVIFPQLEEQVAISDYFTNLDKFIQSHKDKISQLETLKKKLLQNMFI